MRKTSGLLEGRHLIYYGDIHEVGVHMQLTEKATKYADIGRIFSVGGCILVVDGHNHVIMNITLRTKDKLHGSTII